MLCCAEKPLPGCRSRHWEQVGLRHIKSKGRGLTCVVYLHFESHIGHWCGCYSLPKPGALEPGCFANVHYAQHSDVIGACLVSLLAHPTFRPTTHLHRQIIGRLRATCRGHTARGERPVHHTPGDYRVFPRWSALAALQQLFCVDPARGGLPFIKVCKPACMRQANPNS